MSNIKKKTGNSWKVLASGKSTGIAVVNPKLLLPEEEVVSVDTVLERQNEDISLLKRNVAWLAKHGGGGSGGSGGGGGLITEATCDITVNGVATGGQVMVDNNGLIITLNNISAQTPRMWNVVVRVGVTQIAQGTASFTNPVITIPLDKISKYLINHAGNLYVGASYEDDTNGIYGSASWNGSVIENIVNIATTNASFNYEGLATAQLVYQYSVGIVGAYTLTLNVSKNGNIITTKEYPVNINSTAIQTKAISVDELLGEGNQSELVGVYTVDALLSYNADPKVQGSYKSTITIVSDSILVSTTVMSPYEDQPVEVSLSASIRVVYTAYLSGASTFKYKYYIGNTLIKDETNGYFGQEITDTIPVSGREWAVEGSVVPLHIDIVSGDKSTRATYYVKFVAASSTFLEMEPTAKAYMVSEFLSRNYDNGINTFNLSHEGYENGGGTYEISSKLAVQNENNLSAITVLSSGQPYLRLSNGAFAKLDSWRFGNRNYTLPNLLTTKQFTMSICFKADYHPDDYRTVLYCGAVDINTGEMISGVSIDAHDVYINNESRVKLTDNTINIVDITCLQTTVKDTTSSGEVVEKVGYIVKIYLDGVLTAVNQESEFPKLGDAIYFGSRVYNATTGEKADYLCDCNIYNFQLFDHALSDFDIMINYINNKVSTDYSNGNPNFNIINDELKTNFCERGSDGGVVSYMFNKNTKQYSIDFLLDGAGKLSEEALNNYARVLGIPIMLIDVSTDEAWTFNNFVTQQTAGNVSLPATSGKTLQYWDPTYNDFSVKTLNDVTIDLQGTSTLADAVKNLNITVPNDTVFIPKDTWLPEQTYTLKADVVDSSHSNNASVGSFINEVLGFSEEIGDTLYSPFDQTAIDNVYKSDYKKTQQTTASLKHTVEGFPVLLIMKFNTSTTSTVSVTPLGIYSFNLGRDAYRNLGFRKLNSITDSVGEKPVITTFPYVLENARFDETDSNANWIEIKDTTSLADLEDFTNALPSGFDSSKGDFWQNDDNILNTRYEVRFPAGKAVSEYRNFKTFVGNIMQLPIEGTYDTSSMGALTIPQVSDSYDLYTVDNNNNYSKTGYKQAIVTDANTLPQNLGFNPDSMYKYLVVGLLFGLIDNFGKNSTYRSWGETGQYYIDFYDLDCALGGGNQGQLDITPDVWIKFLANKVGADKKYGYVGETFNKSKAHSGTVVSANHSKLWMSLDTAFYRAYSGNNAVNSAYTQYWYALRDYLQDVSVASGYTDFADFFIDNYYIKQTKNCGPLLFNYDYKLKYLLQFSDDSYGNTKDLTKLHGRKIAYARDWLKKHIQFMDSLFYWRDSSQTMTFANDHSSRGSNVVYNTPDAFPMKSNAPIIMYHSVGNTTQTFYFMQSNKETFVNAGSNSSNSALNWNFTNSPNIIQLGNDEYPLSMMNISILSATKNDAALNTTGYPSITDLNLANNNIFGSGFNLAAFERGNISEIRKLNFHATSGASFRLALNNTTATGQTYTKYQKLTDIDISESTCVSGLDIPSVPLTDLKVYRSSITALELIGQKYLGNVDLTGCNKLQRVYITECDAYTEFNITGLANLTEVTILNCPNIKTVNISNCPNLIKVDIEGCTSITDITVNNCPSIVGGGSSNYITIQECPSLKNLDLSNNEKLEVFRITQSNQANITKLHLSNTAITKITGDGVSEALLDLSAFTTLSDFTIQGDAAVKEIQFANVKDKYIILNKTFQGCANLERVYGNLKLTNSSYSGNPGAFRDCSKFSIHGSATTWNNKAAYTNGVPKTPWEICSGVADNRGNAYDSVTANQAFVAGNKVTNLWFSNSSGQLSYTFYGTAVTQFDVYYVFFMLAMSGVTVSQSATYTFRGLTSGSLFAWSQGKQPDRYMFYKCPMVTSFSNTFSSTTTFLYSPEDGKDNGLFSPLVNLSSIGSMFSGSIIFSKKLFHRASGNYGSLGSFTYENVACICDTDEGFSEYSNYSSTAWLAANATSTGNFDGFFKNAPRLRSFVSIFNGTYTINFSTLVFPTSIETIRGAFNPTYGTGEIDLEKMFQEDSTSLSEITNSFIVSGSIGVYGERASFPIRSTMFNNITNIQYVGYISANAGGSVTSTSFSGAGLRKYIADDTFPEDLVAKCRSLRTFAGFFKNVESKAFSTVPSIPGNMFLTNTNLQDVSALMYNADFAFKLSSEGFKNCPNLQRVSYFCYHDLSTTNRSKLTGEIPYRLFYHGHSVTSKVIKGTNQEAEPDASFDTANLLSTTVTYNSYNKGIVAMNRAFYGCINLSAYTNAEGKTFIENNADYTPYKWIYNETAKAWSEGKDSFVQDGSWGYTGQPDSKVSGVKYLEDNVNLVTANTLKTETLNYMCAPDLLRYCTNSSSVGVTGLFEECGFNYSTGYSGGTMSTDENYYDYGIQGRIPPYLLQPISEVSNISRMFKDCRRISSYTDGAAIYQIPEKFFSYAPKITSLVQTFQGLAFIYNTNLNVFGSLVNALDIRCIFAIAIYGDNASGGTWTFSGTFINNVLSRISGAFSCNNLVVADGTEHGVTYREHATMGISANVRTSNNFPSTKIPASANIGYVYYNWGSKATDTAISSANNNYS